MNVVNEIVQGSSDVQTRIMTPKEAVYGRFSFVW